MRAFGRPKLGLLRIAAASVDDPAVRVPLAADRRGAFASRAELGAGDLDARFVFEFEQPVPADADLRARVTEVVLVPAGPFELGDPHPDALALGALDAAGAPPATDRVEDEGPIAIREALAHDPGGVPEYRGAARANDAVAGPGAETSSIRRTTDGARADAPLRPCDFIDWDDTCADLDRIGLRPLRRPDYGVYDLAGSLRELVVTAGHPTGRAYLGSHGDGRLGPDGRADPPDRPSGVPIGRAADGVGYRGGAEYCTEPDLTSPVGAVGERTYTARNGAFRAPTYGARGARTAPGG